MTKAIIFDMYETLVSANKSKLYFGDHIAKDLKIPEEDFRKIWDATDEARTLGKLTFEEVIHEIMVKNNVYTDKLYDKVCRKRRESKEHAMRFYDKELIPLFDTLQSLNIKIGLISNCFNEEIVPIRNFVLFQYFDAVSLSNELGLMKPNPEIYLKTAIALDARTKDCIYVGDGSGGELQGALDVGMRPLQAMWYAKYNKRRPIEPDPNFKQVTHPMGILNFLA